MGVIIKLKRRSSNTKVVDLIFLIWCLVTIADDDYDVAFNGVVVVIDVVHMYKCVYVCMYVCMYVCIYACIHASMYTCLHEYACMYMCVCACVCTMGVCLCACMYDCV